MNSSIRLSIFLLASGKIFDGIEHLDKVRDKWEKSFTSWALGSGWSFMSGSEENRLKALVQKTEQERAALKDELNKKEAAIHLLKMKVAVLETDLAFAQASKKTHETQFQEALQITESSSALAKHLADVALHLCDVVLDGMKNLQNQKEKSDKLLRLASDFFVQANSVVSKNAMTEEYRLAQKAMLEAIKEAGDG